MNVVDCEEAELLRGFGAHVPDRPSWLCARCGAPWPCGAKVAQLLDELASGRQGVWTHVHLYLGSRLVEAAGDLRTVPAGDLYERFFGWFVPAPATAT